MTQQKHKYRQTVALKCKTKVSENCTTTSLIEYSQKILRRRFQKALKQLATSLSENQPFFNSFHIINCQSMIHWKAAVHNPVNETSTWTSTCGNYRIVKYNWNKANNYTLTGKFIAPGGIEFDKLNSAKKHLNLNLITWR